MTWKEIIFGALIFVSLLIVLLGSIWIFTDELNYIDTDKDWVKYLFEESENEMMHWAVLFSGFILTIVGFSGLTFIYKKRILFEKKHYAELWGIDSDYREYREIIAAQKNDIINLKNELDDYKDKVNAIETYLDDKKNKCSNECITNIKKDLGVRAKMRGSAINPNITRMSHYFGTRDLKLPSNRTPGLQYLTRDYSKEEPGWLTPVTEDDDEGAPLLQTDDFESAGRSKNQRQISKILGKEARHFRSKSMPNLGNLNPNGGGLDKLLNLYG